MGILGHEPLKVVFYGARQAQWLCWIYRSLSGAPQDVAWIDAAGPLQPQHREQLAEADLLAMHAFGVAPPVEIAEIAERAERVWFPEVALDFLWPFGGQPHLRNTRDNVFPEGPFPSEIGDSWLNRRLNGRQMPEAIEAEYLALDVAKVVDLDRFRRMALERQAELDRACGEDFASKLEAAYRAEALFANPTTPCPELMRALANRLFAKMRAPFALGQNWRSEAHLPELPVHPSVARHFGLAWTEGRRYRTWTGERIDFEEYVRRYLAYAEGPELESGVKLVADGHPAAARPLLDKANARPMGSRSTSARAAKARAFIADTAAGDAAAALRRAGAMEDADLMAAAGAFVANRWAEAEAAALARLRRGSISADLHVFLALVREKLRDEEGRIASLQSALALRPRDPALQSRLTLALASRGDLAAAIASAEAEVALRPENPHARAFLSHLLERAGDLDRARAELQRVLEIVAVGKEYEGLRKALVRRQADLERPRS